MARENLIFEALFNGTNPFPTSTLYKQACCSHSITQSKTIVREGDGSLRAESKSTDPSVSGGYRPEFIPPTNTRLVDGWYGYSIYFEDWKPCSSCGEHVMQWHPENGTGSAALAVYTNNGTFHIRLNPEGDSTAVTLKDGLKITPNKWYDLVWHVVWSSDKAKGRVEVWIDGTKYVDYTGATLTSGGTPYFKIGINRWNISGVNRVIYIDAVRIGNAQATYADVAPGDSIPEPTTSTTSTSTKAPTTSTTTTTTKVISTSTTTTTTAKPVPNKEVISVVIKYNDGTSEEIKK